MNTESLIQQTLGVQWQQLPPALQAHYANNEAGENIAEGHLSIDYPSWMQLPLHMLRVFGALVNRRGKALPTRVSCTTHEGQQHWHRTITFPDGKQLQFKSRLTRHEATSKLIEFTTPFLGMRFGLTTDENGGVRYQSDTYILKISKYLIAIPDVWLLGRATITETANEDGSFDMNFRIRHPWFGEIFTYYGRFVTTS